MISNASKSLCFISLLILLNLLPLTTSQFSPFESLKYKNENSTFVHPLTSYTPNMTKSAEENKTINKDELSSWCSCSSGMF